jgi:hypothetical protein
MFQAEGLTFPVYRDYFLVLQAKGLTFPVYTDYIWCVAGVLVGFDFSCL